MAANAGKILFLSDGRLLAKERQGTHLKKEFKCPDCGKEIQPDDTFCPRCGKKL